MSNSIPVLDAENRQKTGSRYAKRLREIGRLPVVVYGHGHDPIHKSVDAKAFGEFLQTKSQMVMIKVDGSETSCRLKDVQYDHLHRTPVHADLVIRDLNEVIEAEVAIELKGDCKALGAAGAVLVTPRKTVTLRCKAGDIPESIEHDITDLTEEHALHLGDLALPAGAELVDAPELTIATISVVKAAPEPDEVEGDAAAEPEVIDKGKTEGDGEG